MDRVNKYIIGLGCSWTQGEGGYPDEIWHQYNGRPQISLRGKDDYHIRHYEHENSWVNVLCRDHFTDHTPINLGIKGIGNRAAVEQLYFCDRIDFNNSEGIIVLMLSGFERLDLPGTYSSSDGKDDGYSNGEYMHYKWNTAWPIDSNHLFWKAYAKELYSERLVATNQMLALLNLQNFAKAHNFKLVIANAFNQRNEGIIEYLRETTNSLCDKFDWSTYLHNTTEYVAFVQKLIELDNIMDANDWHSFHQYYFNRDWPAEHLTNCEGAHPTIKGYKVIADELATFIKYKGYA
jgi:hypothetical protein